MSTQDDLEQQLWDYCYGLLEAAEAAALEERITSEHEVACLYAETRQRQELLAAAARIEGERVSLRAPAAASAKQSRELSPAPVSLARPVTHRIAWGFSSAALAVVALVGYTWVRHDWLHEPATLARIEQELAADYIRVVVSGPAEAQPGIDNLYALWVEDVQGAAANVELQVELFNESNQILETRTVSTDEEGCGYVEIDGALVDGETKLRLRTTDGTAQGVTLPIARAEPRFSTYVVTDRDHYRAGDEVFFRTVTQPVLGERSDETSVGATAGAEVLGKQLSRLHRRGVGSGVLQLAPAAAEGRYTVQLDQLALGMPAPQAGFGIAAVRQKSRWDTRLTARSYAIAGEPQTWELETLNESGEPAAGVRVTLSAEQNGELFAFDTKGAVTGQDGKAVVTFQVPRELESGLAEVELRLEKDAEVELLRRSLAVHKADALEAKLGVPASNGVAVQFYPEGGALVADVPNTVYFKVSDPAAQMLPPLGCAVVDKAGKKVAEVAAVENGRGDFYLTPKSGEDYLLQFSWGEAAPELVRAAPPTPLPPVQKLRGKLSAPRPVIEAGDPLEVEVAAADSPAHFLVAATCRGVSVGQRFVEFGDNDDAATQRVTVPLVDEAAGVCDITLYDIEQSPPISIGQRAVYRAPARYWSVELAAESEIAAGQESDWTVQVKDEQGQGRAAVLGVSVVEEAAAPRIPTLASAWYDGGTASKELLATSTFSKARSLNSQTALETALAEMSPQPTGAPIESLAASRGYAKYMNTWHDSDSGLLDEASSGAFAAPVPTRAAPPIVADNLREVEAAYRDAVTAWRDRERDRLHAFALAICGASVALLLALGMLVMLRLAGRSWLWVSAMWACAGSIFVSLMWFTAQPGGTITVAARPVAQFDGRTQVASNPPAEEKMPGTSDGSELADAINLPKQVVVEDIEPSDRPVPLAAIEPLEKTSQRGGLRSVRLQPLYVVPGTADRFGRHHFAEADGDGMTQFRGHIAGGVGGSGADDGLGFGFGSRFDNHWRYALSGFTPPPVDEFALHPSPEPPHARGLVDRKASKQPLARYSVDFGNEVLAYSDIQRASPTAYWNPLVETDDQGTARLRFALPQAGVRYRLRIDAHGAGRVGSLEQTLLVPVPNAALPGPPP